MSLPVKKYLFGNECRKAILEGMEVVHRIVSKTMGAQGRFTLFRYGPRSSTTTKDGFMSARQVYLGDEFQDTGVFHMLEAMHKTVKTSGDGSSLTCLLTYEIFKNAVKYVASGSNPVLVKKGIQLAVDDITEQIKKMAVPVKNSKDLYNIARIAINGDTDIASLIQKAIETVGKDGTVTCRDSKESKNELEIISGMVYKEGYEAPEFITNISNRSWTADNPYVFCYKGELHSGFEISGIINQVLSEDRPILIVCHEIEVKPLRNLIATKFKHGLNVCVITTPGENIGHHRDDVLEDIAVFTGADIFSEFGASPKNAVIENLGSAKQIIVKQDETVIIGGNGDSGDVNARVQVIEKEISESDNDTNTERLNMRKARLCSGIAVIHVGAVTQTELSEKKDRVEDALQSVMAAQESGIVTGGGTALLACKPLDIPIYNDDVKAGYELVFRTQRDPMKTILQNSGIEDPQTIITKCVENPGSGYDVENMCEIKDMKKAGIIDPAKVVYTALANAASIANTMLLTESLIVNKNQETNKE